MVATLPLKGGCEQTIEYRFRSRLPSAPRVQDRFILIAAVEVKRVRAGVGLYSVLILLTGFSVAARQPWMPTVARVMADTARRARGKSHQ